MKGAVRVHGFSSVVLYSGFASNSTSCQSADWSTTQCNKAGAFLISDCCFYRPVLSLLYPFLNNYTEPLTCISQCSPCNMKNHIRKISQNFFVPHPSPFAMDHVMLSRCPPDLECTGTDPSNSNYLDVPLCIQTRSTFPRRTLDGGSSTCTWSLNKTWVKVRTVAKVEWKHCVALFLNGYERDQHGTGLCSHGCIQGTIRMWRLTNSPNTIGYYLADFLV